MSINLLVAGLALERFRGLANKLTSQTAKVGGER